MFAVVILFGVTASAIPAYADNGQSGFNFFAQFQNFFKNMFHIFDMKPQQANSMAGDMRGEEFPSGTPSARPSFVPTRPTGLDRQQMEEERLTKLVSEGKITEEQKSLILAKEEEMEAARQAQMESETELTEEERKAAMEEEQAELRKWAEENGIDMQYLISRPARNMNQGMQPPQGDQQQMRSGGNRNGQMPK